MPDHLLRADKTPPEQRRIPGLASSLKRHEGWQRKAGTAGKKKERSSVQSL